jgi:protein SCO1/2
VRTPAAVLAAVLASLILSSCKLPEPLQDYGIVPDFTLISQSGQPYGSRNLAGHVWVANFIFTTCQGPCPRMSAQFRKIQQETSSPDKLRFVTFTIDPARDTPVVLAAYAKRFQADPARWIFLTGDAKELNKLSSGPFHAGAIDGSLTHSTRFALVDSQNHIRGYYDSSDEEMMRQLVADIRRLVQETA